MFHRYINELTIDRITYLKRLEWLMAAFLLLLQHHAKRREQVHVLRDGGGKADGAHAWNLQHVFLNQLRDVVDVI